MKFPGILAAALAGLMITFSPVEQAAANETEDAVLELFAASGIADTMPQMIHAMNQALEPLMRQASSGLSDEEFKIVMDTFNEIFTDLLPDVLLETVPVYARHFSVSELKEITEFYKTPTGQKIVRLTPQLIQDGMTIGQQWSQRMLPEVLQKLKGRMSKKGINLEL